MEPIAAEYLNTLHTQPALSKDGREERIAKAEGQLAVLLFGIGTLIGTAPKAVRMPKHLLSARARLLGSSAACMCIVCYVLTVCTVCTVS